jgi:hypothetical protein
MVLEFKHKVTYIPSGKRVHKWSQWEFQYVNSPYLHQRHDG